MAGLKKDKSYKKPYEVIADGLVMRDGATFDTEPRFRTLLLKGFIVYLVVMGSMGCLLSSFKIPYNAPIIHLAVFIGALFSAFLYYTKVWENLGYFLLFAFMLGTALLLRKYISSGFFAVVNIISERMAYYFDTEVVQGYAEAIGNRGITVTVAMIYVGWVHAILLNALVSRQMKYFAVMFASFFFLTVPFYLECEPDMFYILMLMAGCAIVFVFRGARHTPITKNDQKFEYLPKKRHINYVYSAKHHLVIVGVLITVVLLFGGMFQLLVQKSDYETLNLRGRSGWKAGTENTVQNIYKNGLWGFFNKYDSIGGLKSGKLGGVNSVSLDYETDLEVTFVPYSSDRIYLRSFTGADYLPYENRWQRSEKYLVSSDGRTRTKNGKLQVAGTKLNELTSDKTARQLRARYEKGTKLSAKARMDVKNIAGGLVGFYPYYVDERMSENLQMMNYRQTFTLTYFPWLTDPGKAEKTPEGKRTMMDQLDDGSVTGVQRVVLEGSKYMSVPRENLEVIDTFIREAGLEQYKNGDASKGVELLKALGAYFQENIPYTYQPGVTPSKEDFVNYFLADNKRGYCAHFASAATLILRRLGYPARYVEGYAIDPTDMSEDAQVRNDLQVKDYYDGDMMLEGGSKVVTVRVTDAMAHAWVEVQLDGHWRVAELTPWSDEEPPSGGFLQGLIDFLSGTSVGGTSRSLDSEGLEGGGAGLDTIGRVMGYGILVVASLAALIALTLLMIRVLGGRLRYVRANRSDRLVMQFHRVSRRADKKLAQLEEKDVAQADVTINYRERVQAMEKTGKLSLREEEREELIRILENAGFSGREIDPDEYEKARNLLR